MIFNFNKVLKFWFNECKPRQWFVKDKKFDLIINKRFYNLVCDLLFALKVAKHVKSNAIVLANNKQTLGIGAGQMSRVDSAKIASQKNSEMEKSDENSLENSVVASDAFFPFADGLLVTISSGAKAVIQPGGSVKDDEVITAANEAGISMVFTGKRHFRH